MTSGPFIAATQSNKRIGHPTLLGRRLHPHRAPSITQME
jgi:hypothetical protein